MKYLVTARPTAVNIADSARKLATYCDEQATRTESSQEYREVLVDKMFEMLSEDIAVNKAIGSFGAQRILELAKEAT